MRSEEDFCQACGANRVAEMQVQMRAKDELGRARVWILVVGIAYLASGLITLAMQRDQLSPHGYNLVLAIVVGLCAAHVGLWVWAKWQPLAAAIIAFLLFVGVQSLQAVVDPSTIYKGLIIKIGFTLAIIRAINAGLAVQRARGAAR
jgi:hypothetical protein